MIACIHYENESVRVEGALHTRVENNNHEGGEQISHRNETTSGVQKTASIIIVEKNED